MRFDGRGPTTGETTELRDENNTRPDDMAAISEDQDDTGDSNGHVSAGSAAEEAKMCELVAVHCLGPNLLGNRTRLTHLCFHFHNISELRRTICRLLRLALPMVAQNLCGYGVQLVAYLYIARLGTYEIAPAILAQTTFNLAGVSANYSQRPDWSKAHWGSPWHAEMPCCEQSALKGYRMANATI